MLHSDLSYFWADLSSYPGNSGGPMVTRAGLVSIVSDQAAVPLVPDDNLSARISFAKIVIARFILDLLEIQAEKDRV